MRELFLTDYEFLLNAEKLSSLTFRLSTFFFTFAFVIQLERHIEILLLNNDCVIVPDFGGFMAHHVNARYDEEESLFLPPLRTLGFNPQLQLNDSLLAQSYIEAYDISYPEAIKRIAAEVDELKQHLADNGSYELNDIGIIAINEEGHYEFTPCEAGILTPRLYGLTSFEMPVISVHRIVPLDTSWQSAKTAKNIPIVEFSKKDAANDDAIMEEAEAEPATEKTITIRVSTLRNIAAACIAVIAFLLFPQQLSQDNLQTATNSQFNAEWLQHIMPKDMTTGRPNLTQAKTSKQITHPDETKAETEAAKEDGETENVAKAEVLPQPSPYYAIVLASQVSKKNAEYFISQLQKKGFSTARMHSKGKTLRVIFGNYRSENEAYNALRPLRQANEEFAEGWVMKFN